MSLSTVAGHPIVGAWRLVSWTIEYADKTLHPFGESPIGSLLYSADGRMLASIAARHRSHLSHAVPAKAPDAERLSAFDSFFSYGGDFTIEGDEVVHRVDIALNPNFVGTVQRRRMYFENEFLTLAAEEEGTQGTRQHRLRWQKNGGGA